MINLNGLWSKSGRLHIWAENSSSISASGALADNDDNTQIYPFACPQEQLNTLLEQLEYEADGQEDIALFLPVTAHAAIPSGELFDQITNETDISLKAFSVPSVFLDCIPALGLLTAIPSNGDAGFRAAASLRYWIEVTKLTLELLTKGKFLPGVSVEGASYQSIWRPVLTEEEDQRRFELLVEHMPTICRAFAQSGGAISARELVESFISKSVDELLRMFLRNYPLVDDSIEPTRSTYRNAALSWFTSLNKQQTEVLGTSFDLANLDTKLKRWSSPFLAKKQKFELKSRISIAPPDSETPTSENPQWLLTFGIQDSRDGENLLLAADLWEGKLGFLDNSQHSRESLEELLLNDLAYVSERFSFVEQALLAGFPTQINISPEQAYGFLRDAPKILEPLNVIIGLPKWWSNPASKFGLTLQVKENADKSANQSEQSGLLGVNSLLDFDWKISVNDQTFDIEEFQKLAEQKSPLIQIGNTWVELDPEQVKATLKFIEKQKKRSQLTVMEAIQFGLGVVDDSAIFPIIGFDAGGWLKQLLSDEKRSIPILDQPKDFKGDLRKYQSEGLSWMHFLKTTGIGGCLADDMGLGKTVQLLSLLQHEREQAPDKKHLPTLLIVPMSILDNWDREAQRFTPDISVYIHHGMQRLVGEDMVNKCQNSDIVLTTYSLAHRDEDPLSRVVWGKIVLDEAQNIKNINTKQTQAIRRISKAQLMQPQREEMCQRIALTGTPLENHLEELWSIFDFLNPGLLGNLNQFRRKFSVPIERYRNVESAESLARVVRPFILRRLKSDPAIINDLPEKIEIELFTQLTGEQSKLYQDTLNEMLHEVDQAVGLHRKGLVLATITKLKQICNHPTLYLKDKSGLSNRSGKLQRLEELLEVILAEGDKALVFTQFAQMGHLLKPHLQERFGQEVLYLHGSLTRKAREKVIERFNAADGPSIFVLSLKAGGFGLNLTQANQVIHYDQWWNPAVQEQATDRAYRIGQTQNVQVRTFICRGTLEERINELLRQKKHLADQIVGSTKNTIAEMSTDELRELLELHNEPL